MPHAHDLWSGLTNILAWLFPDPFFSGFIWPWLACLLTETLTFILPFAANMAQPYDIFSMGNFLFYRFLWSKIGHLIQISKVNLKMTFKVITNITIRWPPPNSITFVYNIFWYDFLQNYLVCYIKMRDPFAAMTHHSTDFEWRIYRIKVVWSRIPYFNQRRNFPFYIREEQNKFSQGVSMSKAIISSPVLYRVDAFGSYKFRTKENSYKSLILFWSSIIFKK